MKTTLKAFLIFSFFVISTPLVLPIDFKGAEFRTIEAYTYGRFEVNYKTSDREGILSTFFTYFDGSPTDPWSAAKWNEIDLEILGRYNDNVQFNAITVGQQNHVRSHFVNFDPSADFHTYAFEWTPQYVAWFIDGIEVYRQTESHIQTLTHPQKIMMNIWIPVYDNWVGDWNPDILPAFAYYDWTSYYAYTPGSGNYGTGNNFTHQWTDNFDTWDESKWQKAAHTFQGNNCDFIPANAVFSGGKLILCLTTAENTGYTDKKGPVIIWSRINNNDKIEAAFSEEVDKTTAENSSNYNIAGVTINSVKQLVDKRKVELEVSSFNRAQNYNLIALNVKDTSGNIMTAKAVQIINNKPLNFPVKINVGGPAWQDYLPDQEWDEKTEYGYLDGTQSQAASSIGNTDEDEIYKAERYGLVTYKIRVPDGVYNLKLMFAENYFTQQGSRVFDVFAEDTAHAQKNIDLYKLAGKGNAYNINFSNVAVTDGILDLYFPAQVNNSLLNGIVIESVATGINENGLEIPHSLTMEQNYPNPFNGSTVIKYSLPVKDNLIFFIYDILGNVVYEKNIGEKNAGEYQLNWNALTNSGSQVSSGVYFYNLKGNISEVTKKLILLY